MSSSFALVFMLAASTVATAATSCGSSSTTDRADPTRASALITPDGGRVDGPLGATIVVPAGALTADTMLGVSLVEDGVYPALPDAAVPLGAVFAFTPHGLTFAVPARITLPSRATPNDGHVVLRAADEASPWALGPDAPLDADGGQVSFSTSQLSLYAVVGAGDGGAAALFPDGSADGCSPDLRSSRWTAMLAAPISLPGHVGGTDLGGATKQGITRPEIEAVLCGGAPRGKTFGDDTDTFAWGAGSEMSVAFDAESGRARFAVLTGAYGGALEFKGVDGSTPYTVRLGVPVQKAAAPLPIPWGDAAGLEALMDEIDRALRATFTPNGAQPPSPCTAAPATCERGSLGTAGFLYFRTFGLALWVGDTSSSDRASTPSRLDVYAVASP
jgi:ZU5 domain